MRKPLFYLAAFLMFFHCAQAQGNRQAPTQNKIGWYMPPEGLPKNIVIFVGEGMGLEQISAAAIKNKGKLNLSQFQTVGYLQPWGDKGNVLSEREIFNSLATGLVLRNQMTGADELGKVPETLMEIAKKHKMATGMVVTGSPTDNLPSSFFLNNYENHTTNEQRAVDLFTFAPDVVFGGGRKYFDKTRSDKRELTKEFYTKGYDVETKARKVGKIGEAKVLALVADTSLYGVKARGDDYLTDATMNADLSLTSGYPYGYMLLVTDWHIARASQQKDVNYAADEVQDIDRAIGAYFKKHGNDKQTLILVLGTPPTAGMSVTDGNLEKGTLEGEWQGKKPSAALIPVFASGPGSERFTGMYRFSDVYTKLANLMNAR